MAMDFTIMVICDTQPHNSLSLLSLILKQPHKRYEKDDTRRNKAFQEAAVFDYKGISNPVSLSCFLNISV